MFPSQAAFYRGFLTLIVDAYLSKVRERQNRCFGLSSVNSVDVSNSTK